MKKVHRREKRKLFLWRQRRQVAGDIAGEREKELTVEKREEEELRRGRRRVEKRDVLLLKVSKALFLGPTFFLEVGKSLNINFFLLLTCYLECGRATYKINTTFILFTPF